MARDENPREDLMPEAVALVRRIELQVEGEPAPVVVGFRIGGAASIFFGDDPVVQFNAQNELRRAYFGGKLIKADRGRLASLIRVRTPTETQLVRLDLDPAETAGFVLEVERRLSNFHDALLAGRMKRLCQIPEQDDVLVAVKAWLSMLPRPLRIAASARV